MHSIEQAGLAILIVSSAALHALSSLTIDFLKNSVDHIALFSCGDIMQQH